jgi:class 3 adenylate cyclase
LETGIPFEFATLVEYLARCSHSTSGDESSWEALHEDNRQRLLDQAEQTLRTIFDAGYRIRRSETKRNTDAEIEKAIRTGDDTGAAEPIARAEHFLQKGEPLLAFNVVQEALEEWPENTRLRQLLGLSLSRSGALHRASDVLQSLLDDGLNDGETEGLLARTHKDLGLSASNDEDRTRHLSAAFDLYEGGYLKSSRRGKIADAYYTGINAATLALLLGRKPRARMIAEHVRQLCADRITHIGDDDDAYWIYATLAEAALINGSIPLATMHYKKAASLAQTRYGDLGSTRKQARLLLAHLGEDPDWLEDTLTVPPVLIYTGHMIDNPKRETARFPARLESVVGDQIRQRIAKIKPVAAYGSAACGADILCLEAVLEHGGETHITLPFPVEEFMQTSVCIGDEGNWRERFEKVIESAESITIASDHQATGSTATFEYANLLLTGMGQLRRRALGTSLVGLAVWDGEKGDGAGGTGSAVGIWQELDMHIECIDVSNPEAADSKASGHPEGDEGSTREKVSSNSFSHQIKAMLFADAVGYSKLAEDQVPVFIERFMGSVADLNDRTEHKPIHVETAGDGLYMVFADTSDAAHYALELSELVTDRDWEAAGLPGNMDIRTALHCGPVFCGTDPITGLAMYTGPHTSRTARIEPITPPGQVYASSAFAAVAVAQGVGGMRFRYMGRTPLAKKYGSLELYHVRRKNNVTARNSTDEM